jgi:hypothetical protein
MPDFKLSKSEDNIIEGLGTKEIRDKRITSNNTTQKISIARFSSFIGRRSSGK